MNKIKQKLTAAVDHVKSHPALYAYIAGGTIATIACTTAMTLYMASQHLIDLEKASDQFAELGVSGLVYKLNDVETYILIPAPENFQM